MEHSQELCSCIRQTSSPRWAARRRNNMMVSRRAWLAGALGLAAVMTLVVGRPQPAVHAQGSDVVVFAAASLKNALDGINTQWQKETGKKATISYGASPALAK